VSRPPSTPPLPAGPPPVEELSDVAWARVERRLWAELDRAPATGAAPSVAARPERERRRWPWLAAGALAVAAAAVIAVVAWPSGSRTLPAMSSRVVTAAAATEVSYGDAAITVAPSSAVLMQGHAERGVAVVLERGSATFAVAAREGRPPFTVLAGAVQVRVIGTRFTVTRSGDDARVDVAHGEVEVVAWGRREVLLAGASWSSDGVREAAVGGSAPVANPDDIAAAHSSPPSEEALAPPAPPAPPPPARVTSPAPATSPPETVVPAVRADDPRAVFRAAEAIEPTDPARAQRLYGRLAAGSSEWAANATFAAARLAFARGDRVTAAGYARSYLARFPGGGNAADAQALLERATRGASR
jgi:hypothetical protein